MIRQTTTATTLRPAKPRSDVGLTLPADSPSGARSRRPFQFSLRTLLGFMLLVGITTSALLYAWRTPPGKSTVSVWRLDRMDGRRGIQVTVRHANGASALIWDEEPFGTADMVSWNRHRGPSNKLQLFRANWDDIESNPAFVESYQDLWDLVKKERDPKWLDEFRQGRQRPQEMASSQFTVDVPDIAVDALNESLLIWEAQPTKYGNWLPNIPAPGVPWSGKE